MKPRPPRGTIGILGGGQLGWMLALEARRMGYRTGVLDPVAGCPAARAADFHICAPLDDLKAAARLAALSDVVTLEWELIPAQTLKRIESLKPLYPSSKVLAIIEDRLTQRKFLKKNGFPQTRFTDIKGMAALKKAASEFGFPCLLKRRRHGYDGKGQLLLRSTADLPQAAELLSAPCVLEAFVAFKMELSVILARGQDGKTAVYPLAENVHKNGILHTTRAPARISKRTERKARELAVALANSLGHVGVMAVELFLTGDGTLLINEIAPRVHNSGHYTWGACSISQFKSHLRAVCGLPLGNPRLLQPAVMVNLLGDLWKNGEPLWEKVRNLPNTRLHLYGKAKPAPARKMGHILLLGKDTDASLLLADRALALLGASATRRP